MITVWTLALTPTALAAGSAHVYSQALSAERVVSKVRNETRTQNTKGERIMRSVKLSLLAVGLIAGSLGLAQAEGLKVGVLNCHEAAGWGLVFTSSKDLKCVFSPADKAAKPERYTGTIKKYGVDIGYQGAAVLLWGVVSSSGKLTPGALAGSYGGAGAEVAWAGGLGANVLVGGSSKGYALQPLNIEGVAGANIAAGVVEVELRPAK
jgi:hypothetical protein